jgi:hypothetical protein
MNLRAVSGCAAAVGRLRARHKRSCRCSSRREIRLLFAGRCAGTPWAASGLSSILHRHARGGGRQARFARALLRGDPRLRHVGHPHHAAAGARRWRNDLVRIAASVVRGRRYDRALAWVGIGDPADPAVCPGCVDAGNIRPHALAAECVGRPRSPPRLGCRELADRPTHAASVGLLVGGLRPALRRRFGADGLCLASARVGGRAPRSRWRRSVGDASTRGVLGAAGSVHGGPSRRAEAARRPALLAARARVIRQVHSVSSRRGGEPLPGAQRERGW